MYINRIDSNKGNSILQIQFQTEIKMFDTTRWMYIFCWYSVWQYREISFAIQFDELKARIYWTECCESLWQICGCNLLDIWALAEYWMHCTSWNRYCSNMVLDSFLPPNISSKFSWISKLLNKTNEYIHLIWL